MEQITVVAKDNVGTLADISYILGKAKINIESLSAVSLSGKAVLVFFVKKADRAKRVLESNDYDVLESEVLVIKIKDQPGELSKVSVLLKKEKVNILNLYYIAKEKGASVLALRVDKYAKAKKLLKPHLDLEA